MCRVALLTADAHGEQWEQKKTHFDWCCCCAGVCLVLWRSQIADFLRCRSGQDCGCYCGGSRTSKMREKNKQYTWKFNNVLCRPNHISEALNENITIFPCRSLYSNIGAYISRDALCATMIGFRLFGGEGAHFVYKDVRVQRFESVHSQLWHKELQIKFRFIPPPSSHLYFFSLYYIFYQKNSDCNSSTSEVKWIEKIESDKVQNIFVWGFLSDKS